MTETNTSPTTRTAPGRGSLVPVAAGAAALGVCCGLPLLGSLGVAGMIAGLGLGSWIAVAVASFVAVIGVLRWRGQRSCDSRPGMAAADPVRPAAVGGTAPHRETAR